MFPFRDFSNMMFPGHSRPFNNCYKCYSVSMLGTDREDVEKGGKIIMPPSALDQLSHSNVEYPMLFKLTNQKKTRQTHAGVLEFIADEGRIYIPFWMMHNLLLEEGDLLQVESISLPVATFSKFQPQSPDFLDITNPKAVLENALRNYACLTTGDLIAIKYNQKIYELCVLETKPGKAVSIIECDMNVDFAPPVGYLENHIQKENKAPEEDEDVEMYAEPSGFVAFSGEGNRLDGKKKKIEKQETITRGKQQVRGIPDYDHPFGLLKFNRSIKPISDRVPEEPKTDDDPTPGHFQGQGFSLKKGKK